MLCRVFIIVERNNGNRTSFYRKVELGEFMKKREKRNYYDSVSFAELKELFSTIPDINTLNKKVLRESPELKVAGCFSLPTRLLLRLTFNGELVKKMSIYEIEKMFELKDIISNEDEFNSMEEVVQKLILDQLKLYYLRLTSNNFKYKAN